MCWLQYWNLTNYNTDITTMSDASGNFTIPVSYDLSGFGLLLGKTSYWNQVYYSIPTILARPLIIEKIPFPWFIIALIAGLFITRKK